MFGQTKNIFGQTKNKVLFCGLGGRYYLKVKQAVLLAGLVISKFLKLFSARCAASFHATLKRANMQTVFIVSVTVRTRRRRFCGFSSLCLQKSVISA